MVTWGSDTSLGTDVTAVNDSTEEFLDAITLAGITAQLQIKVNNESGSVTNGVIISVYDTLDDTSEVWNDVPVYRQNYFPDGIGDEYIPITLTDIYRFRVGFLAEAATDDYTGGGQYRLKTAN